MKLTVLSPDRLVLEADGADFVFLPGEAGDLGVLPDHMPLLTALRVGAVRVRRGHVQETLAVAGGFAEVTPEGVKIIADAAERSHDIDVGRAREARSRAEARLQTARHRPGEVDVERARMGLRRALNRLHVAEAETGHAA